MTSEHSPSILDLTLAAATRDRQTVTPRGEQLRRLTHGVDVRRLSTFVDARGSVTELYDTRWQWHDDPLVFAYTFTIRPGYVKGWNLHREHDDRYAVVSGALELVLYDPRPDSPTYGEVCVIVLTEQDRSLVNIPRNVWHADHNVGSVDLRVINFPTMAYDHRNPDKYRLPLDTPLIPHSFGEAKGW